MLDAVDVLIVEDDALILDLILEVCEDAGLSCCRARTGKEAELLFEQCTPRLVVTDYMLPDISGDRLLERTGAPGIIITASPFSSERWPVIRKPFDIRLFEMLVQRQLRGSAQ